MVSKETQLDRELRRRLLRLLLVCPNMGSTAPVDGDDDDGNNRPPAPLV